MTTNIIGFIIVVAILYLIGMIPVKAQYYYYAPTPFQQGYDAATNYGRTPDMGTIIREQKNTEALVNAIRAQRGLPPCSIGLLGQWMGRPAC